MTGVQMTTRPADDPGPSAADAGWEPSTRLILIWIAATAILWAIYFAFAEAAMPIKHDMAEAYAWGQEFQLGYNQHPPFWAWICGLWFIVFPRAGWAFGLLSSLNAAVGLYGAWLLLGNFASGTRRASAWVLLLLTPLYTFYAYKYDANTIFLSIWPFTLHYFLTSMRRRGWRDVVGFGVCAGVALMSKYYAAILIASCLLALPWHRDWRRYLSAPAPYVSASIAALICAPHVWWLIANRAPPLRYLAAVSGLRWQEVLTLAQKTLIGAVSVNAGVLMLVAVLAWRSRHRAATPSPALGQPLGLLTTLVLAPVILTIAGALLLRTRVTPEMLVGVFPLAPLLVIEVLRPNDIPRLWHVSWRLAAALTVGATLVSPVIAATRAWRQTTEKGVPPAQEVAAEVTRLWHETTGKPLMYVAGSSWWDNWVTFYSADSPHTFVLFDYGRNLWVTPRLIARHGLLAVCREGDPDCPKSVERFRTAQSVQFDLNLSHRFWGFTSPPVHFVVTVIPPTAP